MDATDLVNVALDGPSIRDDCVRVPHATWKVCRSGHTGLPPGAKRLMLNEAGSCPTRTPISIMAHLRHTTIESRHGCEPSTAHCRVHPTMHSIEVVASDSTNPSGSQLGNETKLAYGSSPVEFGGGVSLPGGIVIAIAPTVPFAELLEQQNEERTMRVYEDHRIGGAACRVVTDDWGPLCVSPLTLGSALRFSRTTQVKATSSWEQPYLWPAPHHQLIQ